MDWNQIFIADLSWTYALEILIRTLVMFVFVIIVLRGSGKKGVRQLSLFEVAIIIALGSAAGDPMFSKEAAILPSLLVFTIVLLIYKVMTYFAAKHESVEMVLEGEPVYIIEEGKFVLEDQGQHNFAKDEFFAEMRLESIEHLGQVRTAILETTGKVSFLYYADEDVKPGMPVAPKLYRQKSKHIKQAGLHACTYCGEVEKLAGGKKCNRCDHDEWVPCLSSVRIT